MKKNISIKRRIYRVAFAVILSSIVVCGSFFGSNTYNRSVGRDADSALQALRYVNRAESFFFEYLANVRGYMLAPGQGKYKAGMHEALKGAEQRMDEAKSMTKNPELLKRLKQVVEMDQAEDEIGQRLIAAVESGDQKLAESIYKDEFTPAFDNIIQSVSALRQAYESHRDQAIEARDQGRSLGDLTMVFILIVSSTSIAIYSFALAKSVSASLEGISAELQTAAGSVNSASLNVSTASQTLSETTTQQAAAIEETVSSMEEMSSMLSQTAQNSVTTLNVADEGQKEGEHGKAVISRMLTAMDEIHAANTRLESIVNLIEEIKSKTKVINEIVFETRLLSFNASIEAARAGTHGKGFAVVAEEVGKLAAMSGKAAEEIRNLLDSSTTEVSSVVRGTQERVNAGREISQDCQAVFDTMSDSLEKIRESVRMITAATREQEQGVKQTNQAMAEMDQVTQRNSSNSEALAGQAQHLTHGAKSLLGTVQTLRGMIFGSDVEPMPEDEISSEVALPLTKEELTRVKKISPGLVKSTQELDRSDSRWKAS